MSQDNLTKQISDRLALSESLDEIRKIYGNYSLIDHWKQGEFHHDVVIKVNDMYFVIATNCNGGVKEVFAFNQLPSRGGLWKFRCPNNSEFEGEIPEIISHSKTVHYFDPSELLGNDARSELKEEYRQRQSGGGWVCSIDKK
jgi:hypothetical protein